MNFHFQLSAQRPNDDDVAEVGAVTTAIEEAAKKLAKTKNKYLRLVSFAILIYNYAVNNRLPIFHEARRPSPDFGLVEVVLGGVAEALDIPLDDITQTIGDALEGWGWIEQRQPLGQIVVRLVAAWKRDP